MKALITGSSGFAGSHLAEYLLAQGWEVIGVVCNEHNLTNLKDILPQVRIIRADVRETERMRAILQEIRLERIYHLAVFTSPAKSFYNAKVTWEVNVIGTYNLLSSLAQLELDCRILCVSSVEVYGSVKESELPLREDSPLRPATPYAANKAAGELLAFQYYRSHGIPVVCARLLHHTGPRQSSHCVCSSFTHQIVEAELGRRSGPVKVGNLKVSPDFTDVRDIVRGNYLLLEKGQSGEIYHLCSGRTVSLETVLGHLLSLASKPIDVAVEASLLRSKDVPVLWGDFSLARKTVGWEPQYSLETTLRDLRTYWKESILSGERSGELQGAG